MENLEKFNMVKNNPITKKELFLPCSTCKNISTCSYPDMILLIYILDSIYSTFIVQTEEIIRTMKDTIKSDDIQSMMRLMMAVSEIPKLTEVKNAIEAFSKSIDNIQNIMLINSPISKSKKKRQDQLLDMRSCSLVKNIFNQKEIDDVNSTIDDILQKYNSK